MRFSRGFRSKSILRTTMKQILSILTFIFTSATVFGQADSLIIGVYKHIAKIGIHVEPGRSFGDMHSTSYISKVDTTITSTLILNAANTAILEIDTIINPYSSIPRVNMTGTWSVEGESITVRFSKIASVSRINSIPELPVEYTNLPHETVMYFKIEFYKGKIVDALIPKNDPSDWSKFQKVNAE